jgi:hypothetical protein
MGMNRKALIRNLLLVALITGLAPLSGAGVDAAAAGESPAALCQSTFGESGPVGGPVAGEAPSGDPMTTTIGWDPFDWSGGLREIVTCVSVGGRAAPALTTSRSTPRNDGSLVISLTLPAADPGSLICEQSILLGATSAGQRTTSPVCFKLRAGDVPPGSGAPTPGGAPAPAAPAPAPPAPAPAAPTGPPAPAPKVPVAPKPPATYPASTPPARAAFEAARGGFDVPAARPVLPDPMAGVAVPAPAWPDPASPAAAARPRPSTVAAAAAVAPTPSIPAGAPVAALATTGIDEHIPLAGAGGFLAVGGAAIIFSAPGRRRRPRPMGSPPSS